MIGGDWHKSLRVQLIGLLTVALFPLGSIALFQTNRVAVEADRTAGLALLGMTERAARAEQLLIERAVGAASLFASQVPEFLANPDACFSSLSRFIDDRDEFSFIGILPTTGIVTCSSVRQTLDFSGFPGFDDVMARQERTIDVNTNGTASGDSVFIVSEPYWVDGQFGGFISVSVPHDELPATTGGMADMGLKELMTFNTDGEILTARGSFQNATNELPDGVLLAGLSTDQRNTFRSKNRQGVERRYSIVAIEGSPAAVMAVWQVNDGFQGLRASIVTPVLFPMLMWFASIAVAMLAMNTLVLRHLRRIGRNMDRFADNRVTERDDRKRPPAPKEIEALEDNFERMSQDILRDEAQVENSLREKSVLVKEIHHRVKNNLQLVSSIMNMQIRSAKHNETKRVLRLVQDRVLSLATIHRDLYQSQEGGRVNAGALVSEIVEKSAELIDSKPENVDLQTHISPVMLYPDQAVPLSLLVAEAMTNAAKNVGDPAKGAVSISVTLTQTDQRCDLVISNSIGTPTGEESTGMGTQLMNAFAMQLGGLVTRDQSDDQYTLRLSFDALEFDAEAKDY